MNASKPTPWNYFSREDITNLVQFYDPQKNQNLNELQTVGCFHLWNTLCNEKLRFAYLADEVGMGKTYQALGVVALLHYLKPNAKIIILCPGKEMQKQWSSDWHSFFQNKFCPEGIDANLKTYRIDSNDNESFESRVQPQICESLNDFAAHLISSQSTVYLLRYPSFSLPLRVFDWDAFKDNKEACVTFDVLVNEFRKVMNSIGCYINDDDISPYRNNTKDELSLDDASELFLKIYINKITKLIHTFSPDLIVWDEAQYLRTDATRNDSMRAIFGSHLYQKGCRHLFLSATPAHRDVGDIEQLNSLLVDKNSTEVKPIRIGRNEQNNVEFRQSVSQWMVRRERTFNSQGKQQYRDFKQIPVDMFAEDKGAMYALTFAAIQKKLVELLDGQNNKFRMGEISCNESVRASIESSGGKSTKKTNGDTDSTLEESAKTNNGEPIDEKYLETLGKSFKAIQDVSNGAAPLGLPHAKIDHVVNDLARDCLALGSCTKELVFVRRIATVDELADRLLHEFQRILDARISLMTGEDARSYWGLPPDEQDDSEGNIENEYQENEIVGNAKDLPYFKALSSVKGHLGRLTKYRNSLGKIETSTLRFLLTTSSEMDDNDKALWHGLLKALEITADEYKTFEKDSNKELVLRRCIAHSFRFTDILVDLDILRQKSRSGYVKSWIEKLENPPSGLADYFCNTKVKLRDWFIHFDTIVNKCFKGSGTNNSYTEIAERVASYFAGLSPVARRSGRRKDVNVVPQFKFPIFPNVLICTDVLREGVNLHLFCDRVSHYGIAWNSGDLEQRIGRVERADSLFERKILSNDAYKLRVGFPYLAKTLDERQVMKAINRKKVIDSLFSIIPSKETGECDDSKEIGIVNPSKLQQFEPILPSTPAYPSIGTEWRDENSSNLRLWSAAMRNMHQIAQKFESGEFKYVACRMIGELGVVAIEWEREKKTRNAVWNISDKMVFDTFESRKQWKTTRTLYVPLGSELRISMVQNFWTNADKKISGSSPKDICDGFDFNLERNTHIRRHRVPHPLESLQSRGQNVHFLRWGDHFVIASVVCSLDDLTGENIDAETIASRINKSLPFGWATIHDRHLMLVFPLVQEFSWDNKVKNKVAHLLAHWTDRNQWKLLEGQDDEGNVYRAPISGICEMNTSEAIDILCRAKQWCEDLNKAINNELGENDEWKISSFDKIVKDGKISTVSKIFSYPSYGKYQIGYSLEGLNGPNELKKIKIFISGKAANVRVVSNDLKDIWGSMSNDYANWLEKNGFTFGINTPHFNYAYADHRDGKQYRRICIVLSVDEMEIYSNRDGWVSYISKLAQEQLLNDVFQFNVARTTAENMMLPPVVI
ncbi:DEAD/DEAH box helicase [Undibacterium sp. FT147W]|uniref:DEAD/DEAH box helicase n=1 Tax=Undibacterium rivi TaxID=2828729 RepID=A0ABS5H792_9BURK|nr:DEAD/DEAH box helicase [Undibacterium rivi]MBR7793954.1 DEAD/DEAH box helicase [Undibacterium rivi]